MNPLRRVTPEILDGLAEDDPAAIRSRRDLRRVHRMMGTRAILASRLRRAAARGRQGGLRILELGAGDGTLLLGVARRLEPRWPAVELTLLDRSMIVERSTIEGYAAVGWTAGSLVADVLEWAATDTLDPQPDSPLPRWDLIVANLFLHHFDDATLAVLLGAVARRSDRFLACEPRRGAFAAVGSRLLGAIGASSVTRHDAVASVRAGFRDRELSQLWPRDPKGGWTLHESAARWFTQVFHAERGTTEAT